MEDFGSDPENVYNWELSQSIEVVIYGKFVYVNGHGASPFAYQP